MEIRNFLADFLCVLLPLFVLDAWQVRSSRASTNVYPTPALLSFIFLISSVITTLFNFRLANHLEVNLSIVPLTLAFYLLSWRLSLLVLAAYAFVEIVAGYFTLSHYHLSLTALHTVLRLLPHGLEILGIYAAMVSLAYFFSKDRTQSQRITIFVLTLFC